MKNLRFMVAMVFALIITWQFVPCARAEVNEVDLVINKIPSDPPPSIYVLDGWGMDGVASILGKLEVDTEQWTWLPYQSYWNVGLGIFYGTRNNSPNRQRGIYKFDITPLATVTGQIKEATLIMCCHHSFSSRDPKYPDITEKLFYYMDPGDIANWGSLGVYSGTYMKLLHGFEGSGAEDIISQADVRAQTRAIDPLRFIGRDVDRLYYIDRNMQIGMPQYTWTVTEAIKRDLEAGHPVSTIILAPTDPYGGPMETPNAKGEDGNDLPSNIYLCSWASYEAGTSHYFKPWIRVTYDNAEPKRFEVLKPTTALEGYASATEVHTDGYLLAGSEPNVVGGFRAVLKFPLAEISLPVTSAQLEIWPQYVDGLDSNNTTAYVQLQHYLYENNSAVSTADAVSALVENVGAPMPVDREYPGAIAYAIPDNVNEPETFSSDAPLNEYDSDFQFVWDVAVQVEADRLLGYSHSSFRIVPTDQNGLAMDEPNYGIYFYAQDTPLLDDALTDLIVQPGPNDPDYKYLLRSNPNLYARMPVKMDEVISPPTEIRAPAEREGYIAWRGAGWAIDPENPCNDPNDANYPCDDSAYGYWPYVEADGNEIVVGNNNEGSSKYYGILKYPLAGVDSQVVSATLKLYPISVPVGRETDEGPAPGYGGAYIRLEHYDASVDGNNDYNVPLVDNSTALYPADCFESTRNVGLPLLVTPNDVNTWVSYDVTDQVNHDVAAGLTYCAFRLRAIQEDGNDLPIGLDPCSPFAPYGASFHSLDGPEPDLAPILELDYTGVLPNCWDPAECPGQANGDANCDGSVNLDDLTALKKAWGKSTSDTIGKGVGEYNCCSDFNKIGISEDVVNLDDLTALKIGWGNSYPGSTGEQTCPAGH